MTKPLSPQEQRWTDTLPNELGEQLANKHLDVIRVCADERSRTITDAQKFLAEGLRKLGISAHDRISRTEVLTIVEDQHQHIERFEAALDLIELKLMSVRELVFGPSLMEIAEIIAEVKRIARHAQGERD